MNEFEKNIDKSAKFGNSPVNLDKDTLTDNYNQKNTILDQDTVVPDSEINDDSTNNNEVNLLPNSPPFFVKQQWFFILFLLAFFCFLLFNFF